jgi:hypothetical protein
VALLLLVMFSQRTQYVPLASAIAASAGSSSLILVFSNHLKPLISNRVNADSRTASRPFHFPVSAGIFLALAVSFRFSVTQFKPVIRSKAVAAFGIIALAISITCFFYGKSNRERIPK